MGGSSKKQTVGYKYYLGMHLIMCHGPVDRLLRIRADKRVAWQGDQQGTGRVTINAEDLFGGESREGGISGAVDLEMGLPTQGKNSYLQSQLGSVLPNFRGVVGAVLRQVYLGMNPYLKTLDWRFSRVHVRQNGLAQWYDSKAEIVGTQALSGQIGPLSTGWKYLITSRTDSADYSSPSFDDSTWPEGQMPFASAPGQPYAAANGFPPSMNTNWPLQSKLWLRRKFTVTVNSTIAMEVFIDNQAWVWVNGHLLVDGNDTTQSKVSFNIPASIINVGENTIVMMGLDDAQTGSGDYSYAAFKLAQTGLPQYDMNPAHIIRECLTDPDWGMGYQDSDIDDAAFVRAADTLYDEEMGMSLLWSSQTPIEDFINEVVKHISATLYVDRTSGKFVLKLIRDDYTRETLPVLDEYNISKVEGASRPTLGELVNSVTAVYWEAETGENASITVQDQALIQMQGAVINTTLQYPGFTNGTLAAKVALRALRSLSTPLLSCTVYADRSAASLNIGDVFRLNWPSLEVDDTVMRVTAMALGDGKANTVKLTVVEDAFSFPEVSVVLPSEGAYDGTSVEPLPAVDRLVFEVPYLELVQVMSQTDVDARLDVDTAMGWVGAAALRPLSGVINARMMVDNGAGYAEIGALEFCPGAELSADVGYLDTVLPITGGVDLDQVQLGTWAQVGTEIVAVTALTDTSVTVKRGCLDTQPKTHAAGDTVFFWDVYAHGDSTEYVSSDVVSVKLLTVAGQGQLALSAAPSDSVTIAGRAARPYPPANVKINNSYFPKYTNGAALSAAWVHRDRKQQTASLVGFTEGSIGPESGTTYTMELRGETNALQRTYSAISGTSQTWDTEAADCGFFAQGDPIYHIEGFNTQIPSGYATWRAQSGAPTATFDGSTGAVVLDNPVSTQAYWEISSLALMYDFELEMDFELIQDYYGGQHCGFWLNTGSGDGKGYRISRLSTPTASWSVSRFDSFSSQVAPTQVQDSNPAILVNTRYRLKCVWSASTGLFSLYRDGVLLCHTTAADLTYKTLRPGIFAYGCKLKVHEISLNGHSVINRLNNKVNLVLKSVRSSLSSYQPYDYTVTRVGYGYSYGLSYGGL